MRQYLSFINLVEAHVLAAIRRRHGVKLPKVRLALRKVITAYLERIDRDPAGNLKASEIASTFRSALPRIWRILQGHPGPFIGRVSRSGMVKVS
jgi:hypothetical protein